MSYYEMPPSPTSSSSSASSGMPRTPSSPEFQASGLVLPSLPEYADAFGAQKPKQLSTAERRASHNAVERARRETLNARFLDLASLLPNLKHLRRPSKSAIVSSSIAHVRAARRHRLQASAQLRALNAECDALRREVNAWRGRAGIRLAETPHRDAGFAIVLAGEEPAFDPLDLEAFDEDDDVEFLRATAMRRRAAVAPMEAACEGPLLLSHPYASSQGQSPQPQTASPSPPASAPPSVTAYHPQPSPPHVAAAAPFEAPATATYDDVYVLQQQQHQAHADAAAWSQAYAAQPSLATATQPSW